MNSRQGYTPGLDAALLRVAYEHVDVALYRLSRGLDCEADLHKAKAALAELRQRLGVD